MKILYLHGLGRNGHDGLYQTIKKYIGSLGEILTLDLEVRKPKETLGRILDIVSEFSPTAVIGFSLGGFFADLLPLPFKLYINPALHLPEYISRKTGPLVEEFKLLAEKYRFKYKPKKCFDIVGTEDERIGLATKSLYEEHYGKDSVITFKGGHDVGEEEVRDLIIPHLNILLQ